MQHDKARFTPTRDKKRVSFRTYRGQPLLQGEAMKRDFVEQIRKAQRATGFHLYAWAIFDDEVHLVMSSTAKQSVRMLLDEMKGRFAHRMLRRLKLEEPGVHEQLLDKSGEPHFWHGGGGEDETLKTDEQLTRAIEAVHAEAVRRGLAATPTDWRYSSARWYAGTRDSDDLFIENR